ncbi:MAG: hypothetical protein ACOC7U_10760 [Spirochaetota bacterium]
MILGSCTYNTKLFPIMDMLVSILENDKLKNRLLGIFGPYSWSGGAVKRLEEFANKTRNNVLEPVVESQYAPNTEALDKCRLLGISMAKALGH